MITEIFENLLGEQKIVAKFAAICEGQTWEQIALALYQIVNDIDTMSDACKEDTKAFQDVVLKLQARKNKYLFSPDGYKVVPAVEVDEAVAVALGKNEQQLKDYYKDILNGPLAKSTWGGTEADQRKFWLLSDGTIVPVTHSHYETVTGARVKSNLDLHDEGSIAGYVSPEEETIGLRGVEDQKPTSDQILAVKKIYDKYPTINTVYADMFVISDTAYVPSSRDLTQYLRTGKSREKKPWESMTPNPDMREAVATLDPQEKLRNKYKDQMKLSGSTYAGETGYKFFVLRDGTVIPVMHSHAITAHGAGLTFTELGEAGVADAYIDPARNELDVHASQKLSRQQVITLVGMFVPYRIKEVHLNLIGKNVYQKVRNSKELDYLLTYGTLDERARIEEGLTSHAERELELAGLFDKDSDYEGMLGEAVLELMQTFSNQGHSGFSALLTADIFDRLVKYKPLTELTDNPNEWNDLRKEFDPGDVVGMEFQSDRSPSCFSSDGGRTYYDLDEQAVEHKDEDGTTYITHEGEKVYHTSKSHKE